MNIVVQGIKDRQCVYISRGALQAILSTVASAAATKQGGHLRLVLEDHTTPNRDGLESWDYTVLYELGETLAVGSLESTSPAP